VRIAFNAAPMIVDRQQHADRNRCRREEAGELAKQAKQVTRKGEQGARQIRVRARVVGHAEQTSGRCHSIILSDRR